MMTSQSQKAAELYASRLRRAAPRLYAASASTKTDCLEENNHNKVVLSSRPGVRARVSFT